MDITITFKRRTKSNDYTRYSIIDGMFMWYVHTNKGVITWVRERLYKENMEDIAHEKTIRQLPPNVLMAFNDFINDKLN